MKVVHVNPRLQTVGGAIPMENWGVSWHFCDKHDRLSWLKRSVSTAGKQSTQKSLSLTFFIAKTNNSKFRSLHFSYSIFTNSSQLTLSLVKKKSISPCFHWPATTPLPVLLLLPTLAFFYTRSNLSKILSCWPKIPLTCKLV